MIPHANHKETIRKSLDLLYIIQIFRGLSFSHKLDNQQERFTYTQRIITEAKILYNNPLCVEYLNNYLHNLQKIVTASQFKDIEDFIEYTNLMVSPLINSVENLLSPYTNLKEVKLYLQLIHIIEQLAFQRGLLSSSFHCNAIPARFAYDILHNCNNLISLLGHNNTLEINPKLHNTGALNKTEYFDILTEYINQLIKLEHTSLDNFFKYQTQPSIAQDCYTKVNQLLSPKLANYYINILLNHGEILTYKKKCQILKKEKSCSYMVISGMLKSYIIDDNGNEAILDLFDEGDFFSSEFFMTESLLETLTNDTIIFAIPSATLEYLTDNYHELNIFFHNVLTNFILEKNIYISNIIAKKVKSRLANFLVAQKIDNTNFKFGKYNIARYLNMTPETFSRILKILYKEQKNNKNYLCQYCSYHLATKCPTKEVQHNNCPFA